MEKMVSRRRSNSSFSPLHRSFCTIHTNTLLASPPKSISDKYEVLYHYPFLLGDAKVVAVNFRRGRHWFSADTACGRLPHGLAELSFLLMKDALQRDEGILRREDEQVRRGHGGMCWLFDWEYEQGDDLLDKKGVKIQRRFLK